jgi:hypothetical protein
MRVLAGKMLMIVAGCVCLGGCASIGPPRPPSLELPKPPSDLRASRKGDRVTLTWSVPERTTDRQSVRYLGNTNVCRSLDAGFKQCDDPVGRVAPPPNFAEARKSATPRLIATYADHLTAEFEEQHLAAFATYAVEALNTAGRGAGFSNRVSVPLVPTLPPFASFAAETTAKGVGVSWQCVAAAGRRTNIKYLFRIYRRSDSAMNETKIADVEATECAAGTISPVRSNRVSGIAPSGEGKIATSFLDQSIEWEKTYFYRGTVVSVLEVVGKPPVEVEGDDTPEVRVFAHDIFPPTVPTELQAVYSGPGQSPFIDLVWGPVTDADLAGYNVYRHEAGAAAVKLNTELVKSPAFRDAQVSAGKMFFYSVSAVDQRGNESGQSEEASESVP